MEKVLSHSALNGIQILLFVHIFIYFTFLCNVLSKTKIYSIKTHIYFSFMFLCYVSLRMCFYYMCLSLMVQAYIQFVQMRDLQSIHFLLDWSLRSHFLNRSRLVRLSVLLFVFNVQVAIFELFWWNSDRIMFSTTSHVTSYVE